MQPQATIVIATKDRREDALRALRSCLDQRYAHLEVLVFDDASSDGTAEAIAKEFPSVRICRSVQQKGHIVWRNQGFREARGEIIFSLDDDAYFTDNRTVEQVVELFSQHSGVAAVALPYVEPGTTDSRRHMRHLSEGSSLRSYVGCAHALRKSVALALGGYREFFVRQGEERDLAIRMRERGYDIVFGNSAPVVHTYSPARDIKSMSYYGVRNTLLFDVLNVPAIYLFPRLAIDAVNLLRYKITWKTSPTRLMYVLSGLIESGSFWHLRQPVSVNTYRAYRKLPRHGPLPPRFADDASATWAESSTSDATTGA